MPQGCMESGVAAAHTFLTSTLDGKGQKAKQ
jgi:hypothetical protein